MMPDMLRAIGTTTLTATLGCAAAMAHTETTIHRFDGAPVDAEQIDREARRMMRETNAQGLAMAVVDDGQVAFVRSWDHRNVAANLPIQADPIMYGASLTKAGRWIQERGLRRAAR
jgi:CubicO group peptidase (beta-lactamase class C family)